MARRQETTHHLRLNQAGSIDAEIGVEQAAKRLFGVPDFKYYALADGLRALFARHPGCPVTRIQDTSPKQMPLFGFDSS